MQVFLSSLSVSLRAFALGAVGVYFTRTGNFRTDTKKDVSVILFKALVPMLIAFSLASSASPQLLGTAWVYFVMPFLHAAIAAAFTAAITYVLRIQEFKHTIMAAAVASNTVGLPVVIVSAICETSNVVSETFESQSSCSRTMIALVSIYAISGNFILFVAAPWLMSLDKNEENPRIDSPEQENDHASPCREDQPLCRELQVVPNVAIQQPEPKIESKKRKILVLLRKLLPPPIVGVIVGIILCSIEGFKEKAFQGTSILKSVVSTFQIMGDSSVPFSTFVLGSDLAFGPKGKVRFKAVLGIIISRLLLLPAVSLPLDTLLKLIGALPKDSTDLSFVLLIQSAMPSAMSLGILAQLQGHGGQEVGSILFYQYLMSFVTVTAWVSIFLAWL